MTGLEVAAAGSVIKVVIERGAPEGLARVVPLVIGKTIMVVGPRGSGKSTFIDYLRAGIFLHSQPPETTQVAEKTKPFHVSVGPSKTLTVTVKTTWDMPGQYTSVQLANEAFGVRPHAMVIVLDLTNAESPTWFTEFCARLDERWQDGRRRRNRLRSVIVAMNKIDLVSKDAITSQEQIYRAIAAQYWRSARGPKMTDIAFKPSVMVENPDGTKWVDPVVIGLTKALDKRR